MKWLEVIIKTTDEAYEAVSEMLTTLGSNGVTIYDPIDISKQLEGGNRNGLYDESLLLKLGSDTIVKAYFSDTVDIERLSYDIQIGLGKISTYLPILDKIAEINIVDDKDWANEWKKFFKPVSITKNITIKPTWEQYTESKGEIVIEIDPGMAFGTGTHETTRLCAQLLESYVKENESVIDVGCGTGILSIIASKLGAFKVTAVDIDEAAVKASKENVKINSVDRNIEVLKGELKTVKGKANIIVANILADIIIELIPDLIKHTYSGSKVIVSGIIDKRMNDVLKAYKDAGLILVETQTMGEWAAFVFEV